MESSVDAISSVTSGDHEFALTRVELVDYSPLTKMLVLELGDDNGNVRSKSIFSVLVCTVAGCNFIFITCSLPDSESNKL